MSVLVITGNDTGVGKTVATAALGCHARLAGIDVAVCKPVQTGSADGDDDLAEVGRLAGIDELHGHTRFPEPLAPVAAATRAGMALPTRDALTSWVRGVDAPERLTLVEGAGGLLVELGHGGVTVRDLASGSGRTGTGGGGTWVGHVEPHGVDAGSACFARHFMRRAGDRRVAAFPGRSGAGQSRGACRTGAGARGAAGGRWFVDPRRVRIAELGRVRPSVGRKPGLTWFTPSSWSSTRTPRRRSGASGTSCAPRGYRVKLLRAGHTRR